MLHTLQAVIIHPVEERINVVITHVPRGAHIAYWERSSGEARGEVRTWSQLSTYVKLLTEPELDSNRGEVNAS